jgi:hypothetical protein
MFLQYLKTWKHAGKQWGMGYNIRVWKKYQIDIKTNLKHMMYMEMERLRNCKTEF